MNHTLLDRCIEQLLAVREERPGTEVCLSEADIIYVVRKCREVRSLRQRVCGFCGYSKTAQLHYRRLR